MLNPNTVLTTEEKALKKTDPRTPRLNRKQLLAARLVAEGCSPRQVAGQLGTTSRTVNRWKSVPRFQLEVARVHELITIQKSKTQPDRPPDFLFSGGAQLRGRDGRTDHRYPSASQIDRPPLKLIEQADREIESLIADLLQCEPEELRRAS